jgi:hypothetical protein
MSIEDPNSSSGVATTALATVTDQQVIPEEEGGHVLFWARCPLAGS